MISDVMTVLHHTQTLAPVSMFFSWSGLRWIWSLSRGRYTPWMGGEFITEIVSTEDMIYYVYRKYYVSIKSINNALQNVTIATVAKWLPIGM